MYLVTAEVVLLIGMGAIPAIVVQHSPIRVRSFVRSFALALRLGSYLARSTCCLLEALTLPVELGLGL